MRYLLIVIFLFPCFVFGQTAPDSYAIYSKFLKVYKTNNRIRRHFLVKGSTDQFSKYDTTELKQLTKGMRSYLKGDKHALAELGMFGSFADMVKKDTLWVPLIIELDRVIKNDFIVKKKFHGVKTSIITQSEYDKYFKDGRSRKAWLTFHLKYSKKSAIIGLSEIAEDGKRAVFNFESNYGELGGEGGLVLFYKENSEWKFLMYLRIWQA